MLFLRVTELMLLREFSLLARNYFRLVGDYWTFELAGLEGSLGVEMLSSLFMGDYTSRYVAMFESAEMLDSEQLLSSRSRRFILLF